jgi:hypothetical protein
VTERNTGPADRDPSQSNPATATESNQVPAAETDFTTPGLETPNSPTTDVDPTPGSQRPLSAVEPNFATTDVDPAPGSPRPLSAVEPNFATTDVDPTPGSPRRPLSAVEPNFATTDVDPTPGSPRPLAAVEPNFATTDVDPTPGSPPGRHRYGVSGDVAADPAVDTGRPDLLPPKGR